MKKLNLIINVVLVIAIGVLYILHFSSQSSNGQAQEENTSNILPAVEGSSAQFAFVRIDTLLANMDMYIDFSDQYAMKQSKLESSLSAQAQSLEKEFIDYQTKASKGLLTRREAQEIESGLGAKQQQLEIQRNNALSELQEENVVSTNKVMNFIEEYLKEYNSDKRYKYIFSYSFGNNLLYANKADDITVQVLEGLNKKYQENNSEK